MRKPTAGVGSNQYVTRTGGAARAADAALRDVCARGDENEWDSTHRLYRPLSGWSWSGVLQHVRESMPPEASFADVSDRVATDLMRLLRVGWAPCPGQDGFCWQPPDDFAAAVAAVDLYDTPPPATPRPHPPGWIAARSGSGSDGAAAWRHLHAQRNLISRGITIDHLANEWVGSTTRDLPHRLAHLAAVARQDGWDYPADGQTRSVAVPVDTQLAAATGEALAAFGLTDESGPLVATLVRWEIHTRPKPPEFARSRRWVTEPLRGTGIGPVNLDKGEVPFSEANEIEWMNWAKQHLGQTRKQLNLGEQRLLRMLTP